MKTKSLILTLLITAAMSATAFGTMLDLTKLGSSGFINGAEFLQGTINPTGTGVYEPFLRLQKNGIEQGFNTSAPNVLDNKAGIWTKDLKASIMPIITVNGKQYRELRLDINETKTTKGRYLSLDSLEIYLQDTGGINKKADLKNLVYSLDTATVDNYVKLDYSLAPGSGWDDMSVLLPETIFAGSSNHPYFYLYSKFGVNFPSDAGFEEWAADPPVTNVPVPEPSTFLLFGAGLAGVAFLRRRNTK